MNKSDTVAIIRSLLSSTNSTYSIHSLNKDFKNETGVDIPLFGYGNIGDFLNSIPDTVKVTGIYPIQQISLVTNEKSAHIVSLVKRQKKNGPRNKFFSKTKSLSRELRIGTSFGPEEVKESKIVSEKQAPDEFEDKIYSSSSDRFISLRNFFWSEECIPSIDVRLHTQIGEYAEVCPCWIFTPDKFYFHFRKFKRKFYDFTKKLQMFYAHEEIPYLADDKVKPKYPCVVFHKIFSEAMWYRAEIQEISQRSQIIVNFVDYGNNAEISKENVKYLHQNFQSFPRQALLGSLANIKPVKGQSEWSRRSIKRFRDLAFEKDLVGGVVYMDDKDGCMGMALSWTEGSEVHINDALVKEGYAEFDINVLRCDFGEVSSRVTLFKTPLKSNVSENVQSPVFFFRSDYCNNMRLKKMFSFAEEK